MNKSDMIDFIVDFEFAGGGNIPPIVVAKSSEDGIRRIYKLVSKGEEPSLKDVYDAAGIPMGALI